MKQFSPRLYLFMHGWLDQANQNRKRVITTGLISTGPTLIVLIIPEGAKLEAAALRKPVEVERA